METCVERAAKALDTYQPGWAEKVNTSKLDLRSNRNCVIGQVFDGFDSYRGVAARSNLSMRGLFMEAFMPGDGHRKLWVAEIRKRTGAIANLDLLHESRRRFLRESALYLPPEWEEAAADPLLEVVACAI